MSSWLKIETTTPEKPEVIGIAERLKLEPETAFGKLFLVWRWADANSIDGTNVPVSRAFLDRMVRRKGFAAAMEAVGWLKGDDGALEFPGFERHNGNSAKSRAETNRRVAIHRQRNAKGVTSVTRETEQKPLPDKIREEKSSTTTTTAREALAESLISAYARPSFDRPALEAVIDCLKRYDGKFTFEQIREGVAAVTAAVKDWPEDERAVYLPKAANFFREDGWRRHPSEWVSHREAKKRLHSQHQPAIPVDIGKRRPAGVLDTTAPAIASHAEELKF